MRAEALAERLAIAWATPEQDRLFLDGPSGRRRFLDRLVLGFAPAAALFGLFLYTNWSRFGSPLESGYGGVVTSAWFLKPSGVGLAGVQGERHAGVAQQVQGLDVI